MGDQMKTLDQLEKAHAMQMVLDEALSRISRELDKINKVLDKKPNSPLKYKIKNLKWKMDIIGKVGYLIDQLTIDNFDNFEVNLRKILPLWQYDKFYEEVDQIDLRQVIGMSEDEWKIFREKLAEKILNSGNDYKLFEIAKKLGIKHFF